VVVGGWGRGSWGGRGRKHVPPRVEKEREREGGMVRLIVAIGRERERESGGMIVRA